MGNRDRTAPDVQQPDRVHEGGQSARFDGPRKVDAGQAQRPEGRIVHERAQTVPEGIPDDAVQGGGRECGHGALQKTGFKRTAWAHNRFRTHPRAAQGNPYRSGPLPSTGLGLSQGSPVGLGEDSLEKALRSPVSRFSPPALVFSGSFWGNVAARRILPRRGPMRLEPSRIRGCGPCRRWR